MKTFSNQALSRLKLLASNENVDVNSRDPYARDPYHVSLPFQTVERGRQREDPMGYSKNVTDGWQVLGSLGTHVSSFASVELSPQARRTQIRGRGWIKKKQIEKVLEPPASHAHYFEHCRVVSVLVFGVLP